MRVAREPENLNIPAARLLVLTTMIIGLILGIVHAFEHDRNIQLQIDAGEIPRHHIDVVELEKATCYVYSASSKAGLSCVPR